MAKFDFSSYNDEDCYFEKFRNRSTKKKKEIKEVRKDKRNIWIENDSYDSIDAAFERLSSAPEPPKAKPFTSQNTVQSRPRLDKVFKEVKEEKVSSELQQKTFNYGPNTREINNIKIDYDRVDSVEKLSGTYQGHESFGIKVTFANKNKTYKVIWFGRNEFKRDIIFTEEYNFFLSLRGTR